MKLKLTNFSNMNPDMPEYSAKNQHYVISGSDPRYWRAQTSVQEKYQAPLAAAVTWNNIGSITGGTVTTCMVPSFASAYDILTIDDNATVHGLSSPNVLINLGQPGLSVGSIQANACSYNGNFFVTDTNTGTVFKKALTDVTTGGYTIGFSKRSWTNGFTSMCTFLDFLAFADTASGVTGATFSARSTVRKFDTSGLVTDCVTLSKSASGSGVWDIIALENYRNQYLAIAGVYTSNGNPVSGISQTGYGFVFLWDGKASTYNTAVQIPGNFISMKTIQGTLYLLTQERTGQYSLWYLVGTMFKRVTHLSIDSPKTTVGGGFRTDLSLFEYANQLGVNLSAQGLYILGEDRFIISPQQLDRAVKAINGTLYGSSGILNYSFNGVAKESITYKSQWIHFEDVTSIIVKYATPPPLPGDLIQVTLDGYDEDGLASSSLVLPAITSTTFYNSYKTPLDCLGFRGNMVRVTVVTNSTVSWQPIIREIELINNK